MDGRRRTTRRGAGITIAALVVLLLAATVPAAATPLGSASAAARASGARPSVLRLAVQARLVHGGALTAIACATSRSCMALDAHGRAYRFAGSRWSAAHPLASGAPGPGGVAIACPGPALCLAIPNGSMDVAEWNGSAWSGPTPLEGAVALESLGCSRSDYCAAVDAEGNAFAWQRGSWVRTAGDWGSVASIACVTSSFCVSAGPTGLSTWNGGRWTLPEGFGATSPFTAVSCPSVRWCVAVDRNGQALRWDGSSWSRPVEIEAQTDSATALGPYPTAVSCPSSGLCIAVDDAGAVIELRSGRWRRTPTGPGHVFTAVSCPTATFCAATDRGGQVLVARV